MSGQQRPVSRDDAIAGLINGTMFVLLGAAVPGFTLWVLITQFDVWTAHLRASGLSDWGEVSQGALLLMLLWYSAGMIREGVGMLRTNAAILRAPKAS